MSRPFLIDTDTASDDAVALMMALAWPDVRVVAVTVVAGNVPLEQAVRNALFTMELCGAEVPVHAGAARPLRRDLVDARWFHGDDGMGDLGYPEPSRRAASAGAVDVLVKTARTWPGLVLVTLGPLTNLALAVLQAPEIVERISRCVIMGGAACAAGNVTPAAEYNMWVDPEAARIVFRSGLPIELVGWELCRGAANLTQAEMARLRALGTRQAAVAVDCNRRAVEANYRQSRDPGLALPDPVAMAIALDPAVCTRRSRHYVDVEVDSELTRGMTVVDLLGVAADARNRVVWAPLVARDPSVTVCWEIDVARWKQVLFRTLGQGV